HGLLLGKADCIAAIRRTEWNAIRCHLDHVRRTTVGISDVDGAHRMGRRVPLRATGASQQTTATRQSQPILRGERSADQRTESDGKARAVVQTKLLVSSGYRILGPPGIEPGTP